MSAVRSDFGVRKLALKDKENPEGGASSLKAYIDGGVFVVEGYDSGPTVKEFYGEWDYEYWIKVQPGQYPEDILSAIKRFSSLKDIIAWLDSQGIKYEYSSWI